MESSASKLNSQSEGEGAEHDFNPFEEFEETEIVIEAEKTAQGHNKDITNSTGLNQAGNGMNHSVRHLQDNRNPFAEEQDEVTDGRNVKDAARHSVYPRMAHTTSNFRPFDQKTNSRNFEDGLREMSGKNFSTSERSRAGVNQLVRVHKGSEEEHETFEQPMVNPDTNSHQLSELSAELRSFREELTRFQERIRTLESDNATLTAENAKKAKDIAELVSDRRNLKQEFAQLSQEVVSTRSQMTTLGIEMAENHVKVSSIKSEITSTKSGLIGGKTFQTGSLSSQKGNLSSERSCLPTQSTSLQSEISSLKSDMANKSTQLQSLTAELSSLRSENTNLAADNGSLIKHVERLKNQVNTLNSQLANRTDPRTEDSPCCKLRGLVYCKGLVFGCQNGNIWGTDRYSKDSNLCTAARHCGVIGIAGGIFKAQPLGKLNVYFGCTRNGVTSRDWDEEHEAISLAGVVLFE